MKKTILLLMILAASFVVNAQRPTCKGLKKDGTPCHQVIINKAGYCRLHDPGAKHCQFIKKNGEPCKMVVKQDEQYCRFHKH